MDRIRPLVKTIQGESIEYFPKSNYQTVTAGKLPSSLPGIWHAVYSINEVGIMTLDQNYLLSSDLDPNQFIAWLDRIGLKPKKLSATQIQIGIPVNQITSRVYEAAKTPLRYLTEEEINDILDDFPIFPASTQKYMDLIRSKMQEFYRDKLRKLKVDPSTIPWRKAEIIAKLQRSIIASGSAVGIMMADALAAQLMQGTLDAKRFGGASANIEQSIAALSEILRTLKRPKMPMMTLFFKNREVTPDDLNRFIDKYEYVSLYDIVKNIETDVRIEPNNLKDLWWAKIYSRLNRIELPETKNILLIELDQTAMYYDAVSMNQVVQALESLEGIYVLASPIQIGQIILVPNPDKIEEVLVKEKIKFDIEYAGHVYLTSIIKPKLSDLPIKGIKDINYMYIKYKTVNPLIIDQYKISENIWTLEFNQYQMKRDCLKVKDITRLLKVLGFEIKSNLKTLQENKIMVKFSGPDPMRHIVDSINQDQKNYEKLQEEGTKINQIYLEPDTPLMRANRIYYLETDGSNLKEILLAPELDYKYCYTNTFGEMLNLFGIGVTRMVLMNRLGSVIGEGDKYIDPAWILLCTDLMTNRGKINGINFSGLQDTQSDIFGLISSERPAELTLKWAAIGKSQKGNGVSAKIAMGKPPLVGTELVQITEDREMVRKLAETGMKFDPSLIQARLKEFNSPRINTAAPKFKKPASVSPSQVHFKTSNKTSQVLDTQPSVVLVGSLLQESVQPFINVPAEDDIVVVPKDIQKPSKEITVYLNSEMPIYTLPQIPMFNQSPGIPKAIKSMITQFK